MAKVTWTETVRLHLEREIRAGIHPPGPHLDEIGLAHWLGCSRTPLREALNQLVAVGLLDRRSHRGVFVASSDSGAVIALAEACAKMEAACAGLAERRMSEPMRAELCRLAVAARQVRDRLARMG